MSQVPPNQPNSNQPQPGVPPQAGMPPQPGVPQAAPVNPYSTPTQQAYAQPAPYQQQGDATGGVIPYKNPKALIGYYVSIISLLLWPLGFVALILGILGLRDRQANPVIKGSVHAWIAVIIGALTTLLSLGVAVLIVIAIASN